MSKLNLKYPREAVAGAHLILDALQTLGGNYEAAVEALAFATASKICMKNGLAERETLVQHFDATFLDSMNALRDFKTPA